MPKKNREQLLEEALKAAEDIISWHDSESDRSCYDEEDVPKDLRELEEVLNKAKEKLK
jgi:hypothetical protein